METREEIREGIVALTHEKIVAKVATRWKLGYTDKEMDKWLEEYVEDLFQYLHGNDVVIKVDKELPADGKGSLEDWSYEYVAVEPLIKEKQ